MKTYKIMKTYINIIKLCLVVVFLSGCQEDFLDRPDLDDISSDNFWKTPTDLGLYVTQFYSGFPAWGNNTWNAGIYWVDQNADTEINGGQPNVRLRGDNTINSSISNWTFSRIRAVNVMLENFGTVVGSQDQIDRYVGEAYFFRAYFHFRLVQSYGDVPWVSSVLSPSDAELMSPRMPRNQVVDNILADLDQAINLMPTGKQSGGNRLCKEIALLFKSRVALYEGTWNKYHAGTDFGVSGSDGSGYLTIAANAAEELINNPSGFSIYGTNNPNTDYWSLFNQVDYSGNSEMMLWKGFNADGGFFHNVNLRLNGGDTGGVSITKTLVDSYLCTDGDPIGVSALYQGDAGLINVSTDRDPRLSQTMWLPGQLINSADPTNTFILPEVSGVVESIAPTGYQIRKGSSTVPSYQEQKAGETGNPIFRFAEALLNFAEAKAELGTISQTDLDKSVNELRDRVNMPHLVILNIAPDPNWLFPTLTPIINEVRRERAVELAVEGHRFFDLSRWAVMDDLIVGKRPKGAFFVQADYPDSVPGVNVLLDSNGYIDFFQSQIPNGYEFDVNRDYLLPIPLNELTLNPNLKPNNPGW